MKNIIASIIFFYCLNQLFAQADNRGVAVSNNTKDVDVVKGNTYAIIIGISKYKNISHLQYADKDAENFQNFLLSDAGGKVPGKNIETFLNENAIRTNVGDAISLEVRRAKPGDRIYFFFAGHGDMEDLTQIENGLLLLYNSPDGNYFGMNDDVLEILDLKRYLSPLSQRGIEVYFIVDACHSGNLKGGVQGIEQTASALASSWGKEFKILSCQPNQISLESKEWGGGRGLFSFELEEGMKGLADKNNDGKITLLELQQYITDNVSAMSDGTQIPLVVGDLSKNVATVNPYILAALKKEKAGNYPMLAKATPKGNTEEYLDSLDASSIKLYRTFEKNRSEKNLIVPKESNAMLNYRLFEKKNPGNPIIKFMRRDLASSLNEKFDSIVSPLLKGERSYSSREECRLVSVELDSCLNLLGEHHYMYNNIKARKLYMEAMSLTWALTESEYNIGLKPVIEKAIVLLEQSKKLEPNASYTLSALGVRDLYVFDYNKAYIEFNKYLTLRPYDFYAKYSLAVTLKNLGQYSKAAVLFEELLNGNTREPSMQILLYSQLAETYFYDNNRKEAYNYSKRILDISQDKDFGYSNLGVFYTMANNIDSAIYYYKLSRQFKVSTTTDFANNNIGYLYLLNNQMDSAKHYLNLSIIEDSTVPHPYFNLGTIDVLKGNYSEAIENFMIAINKSKISDELFIDHFDIYFNKKYNVADSLLYKELNNKVQPFNVTYISYLCMLYCYLRDEILINKKDKIEYIFSQLHTYKQYEALTYYHYACYKSLQKNKETAINNIKKALRLGFGNYFLLTSDNDLEFIRNAPQFIALLKEYFPGKVK